MNENLILACAGTKLSPIKLKEIDEYACCINDWENVISLATRHGVLPLLYHNLKKSCPDSVPFDVMERLKKAYRGNAIQNLSNSIHLLKLVQLFQEHDIQAVPFKGPAIAEKAYDDLNLRSFSDLDILVKKEDVPKVKRLMLREGYRAEIDLPAKHEEKFMEQENSISFYHKSSIPIDLHWEITGRYLLCPVYMDTFADRIESTLFFERDIFSIPDDIMLVYLCVHGTSHCWERLEWLCCFIELLNRQNEETIFNALNFAEQINAKRIFLLGLFLGQSVLEAKYPANVQSVIEYDDGIVKAGEKISSQMFDTGSDSGHDSSAGAAWRFSPLHVMIRDSLKDKIGYLVFLLTMPTVKEWSKYPIPYTLTPFYRVIRPFRLAWLFLVGNKLERSFFSSGYKRVKEMVAKKRMKGRGLFFTCFIYLPGRFIEKFLSNSCILINKYIFNKYINKQRLERFHDSHDHIMDHHFYMIGMPGKIDFLEASLELIHNKINLFVILNGVKEGEKKQITKKFPDLPVFDLSTFYSSSIPHGEVINLLMQANEKPFGLIDHDLYIFNDQIFSQLDFNNDEFISGPFEIHNQKAELTFPATFFLYINTPIVKKIMNKYNIGAQIYTRIPSRLLPILNDMNLGYDNFLKGYLNYFDPFNLIFAMAFYEGYKAKILKKNEKDMIHLGGHATDEIIQSKEKLKQVIDSIRQ